MLAQKIFIFGVSAKGNNEFTMTPYFSVSAMAGYVNLGDVITDGNSNKFQVIALNTTPNTDGGTIRVKGITSTATPKTDSDYTSTIETPGQVDLYEQIKTGGNITLVTTYSSYDYIYTITATWTQATQANKAKVGDSIMDSIGREFVIVAIPTNITSPIRVQEKERIGSGPRTGAATLYRATPNTKSFTGQFVSNAANTAIQNRDNMVIDTLMKQDYETRLIQDATPVEPADGVRTTFTIPNAHEIEAGSLVVYVNGVREPNFTETSETTFSIASMEWIPDSADSITIDYVKVKTFKV